jgi:hypothetical protein
MSYIRTWPKRIYLQQGEERGNYPGANDVTWHDEPIFDEDVEYVRIDLFNSLKARLRKAGQSPESES